MDTLFQLIDDKICKKTKDISHIMEVVKDIKITGWKEYVKENEDRYNKVLVKQNDCFDLCIITWTGGQGSAVHDHACNGCVYIILDGELTEELFSSPGSPGRVTHSIARDSSDKLELKTSRVLKKGQVGYIHNKIGYHAITNKTDKTAVSLHIYSPPNHKTKYF